MNEKDKILQRDINNKTHFDNSVQMIITDIMIRVSMIFFNDFNSYFSNDKTSKNVVQDI